LIKGVKKRIETGYQLGSGTKETASGCWKIERLRSGRMRTVQWFQETMQQEHRIARSRVSEGGPKRRTIQALFQQMEYSEVHAGGSSTPGLPPIDRGVRHPKSAREVLLRKAEGLSYLSYSGWGHARRHLFPPRPLLFVKRKGGPREPPFHDLQGASRSGSRSPP
jgi:hypothetical protein